MIPISTSSLNSGDTFLDKTYFVSSTDNKTEQNNSTAIPRPCSPLPLLTLCSLIALISSKKRYLLFPFHNTHLSTFQQSAAGNKPSKQHFSTFSKGTLKSVPNYANQRDTSAADCSLASPTSTTYFSPKNHAHERLVLVFVPFLFYTFFTWLQPTSTTGFKQSQPKLKSTNYF